MDQLPQLQDLNNARALPIPGTQLQRNPLLAALARCARQDLSRVVELVPLAYGQVLHESGMSMRHVYFPIDAVVSMMHVMRDGSSAEIAVVGNDGMLGVSLLMGGETTPCRAQVLRAGHAFRLGGNWLKQEFDANAPFQQLLLRYTQALLTQMAHTAVCGRRHSVHQQVCRRLLVGLDRMPSAELMMTHDLIASLLGVRREGVTEAARKLQKLHLIEYTRGRIVVLNRHGLEQQACECYAMVRSECDRLLPRPVAQARVEVPEQVCAARHAPAPAVMPQSAPSIAARPQSAGVGEFHRTAQRRTRCRVMA